MKKDQNYKIVFPENVKTNEILSAIFSSMPNLNYWSYDALKELYLGALQMTRELGGRISKRMLYYLPKNQQKMLEKIYDIILRADGLSTLSGFGISNSFGDSLKGNPERQSLHQNL